MDINDFIGNNPAGDLMLAFFNWGYRTPEAARKGTQRRVKREDAIRQFHAGRLAGTPGFHASRQMIRAAQRDFEKAMLAKIPNHTKRRAERQKLIVLHRASHQSRVAA